MNNTKKCRPATDDVEVEIHDVPDDPAPSVPPPITNGHVSEEHKDEPGERRAGIQAPVIKVDENSDTVKKYPKSSE